MSPMRKLRQKLTGKTQVELANDLKFSVPVVIRSENRDPKQGVSLKFLRELAGYYKIPISKLMEHYYLTKGL